MDLHMEQKLNAIYYASGVGKLRPTGQIWSIHVSKLHLS